MTRLALFVFAASILPISAGSPPAATRATPVDVDVAEVAAVPAPARPVVDPVLDAYVGAFAKDALGPLRYASSTYGAGEQQMTFVYLIGPEYCGSAGCSLLVLHRREAAFDLLGKISTVYATVRVLPTRTNGRPDLAVRTRGEGVSTVDKVIPFNGRRYLWSPNLEAARDIENPGGEVVLTDDTPKATVLAE